MESQKKIDKILRNLFVSKKNITDTTYQENYKDEGKRKSEYIIDILANDIKIRHVELSKFLYVSIGGADGSEIVEILSKTSINKAILLEYSDEACELARKNKATLKEKSLDIMQGDATQRLDDLIQKMEKIRDEEDFVGLILSIQAVLHELPKRSPNFDVSVFLGKLFSVFKNNIFFSREPIKVDGWPDIVQLNIDQVDAKSLKTLADIINDKLHITDTLTHSVAGNYVQIDSNLALELLHKFLRAENLDQLKYELGEQLTSIDHEDLRHKIQNYLGAYTVTVVRSMTDGFKDAWDALNVNVKNSNGRVIPYPNTHAKFIGISLANDIPNQTSTSSDTDNYDSAQKNKLNNTLKSKNLSNLTENPICPPITSKFQDILYSGDTQSISNITEVNTEFSNYSVSSPKLFVGRKSQLSDICSKLTEGKPVIVSGAPGIGKSTLCKQSIARIQAKLKTNCIYIEIDCQKISTMEILYQHCILACKPTTDLKGLIESKQNLRNVALKYCKELPSLGIFFDNFEVLNDIPSSEASLYDLVLFLYELYEAQVRILIASRYGRIQHNGFIETAQKINDVCARIVIDRLSDDDIRKLFKHYNDRPWLSCEGSHFDKLIHYIDGHPLMAILVLGWVDNQLNWEDALADLASQKEGETKMTATCSRSWALLGHCEKAKILWGTMAWSTFGIPIIWITARPDAKEWNQALMRLIRLNLISFKDGLIDMLIPIKEEFNKMSRAAKGEKFAHDRLECWITLISNLLSNKLTNSQVSDYLPNVLQVLVKIIEEIDTLNFAGRIEKIISINEALRRYYSFDLIASKLYLSFLLNYAETKNIQTLEAAACQGLGICYYYYSQYDNAEKFLVRSGDIYKQTNNMLGLANTLSFMGNMQRFRDYYPQALELLDEAEGIQKEKSDFLGLAETKFRKGILYHIQENRCMAWAFLTKAEDYFKKEEDYLGHARILMSKGDICRLSSQYNDANKLYDLAEKYFQQVGEKHGIWSVRRRKGDVCFFCLDFTQALQFYEICKHQYEQMGYQHELAHILKDMGKAYTCQNNFNAAEDFFKRSEEIYKKLHSIFGIAEILCNKGDLFCKRSMYKKANRHYMNALEQYEKADKKQGIAKALRGMGYVAHGNKQYQQALDFYTKAETIFKKAQDQHSLCFLYLSMAESIRMLSKDTQAETFIIQANIISRKIFGKNISGTTPPVI